jgi:hypothetical protein
MDMVSHGHGSVNITDRFSDETNAEPDLLKKLPAREPHFQFAAA